MRGRPKTLQQYAFEINTRFVSGMARTMQKKKYRFAPGKDMKQKTFSSEIFQSQSPALLRSRPGGSFWFLTEAVGQTVDRRRQILFRKLQSQSINHFPKTALPVLQSKSVAL